MKVQQVHAWRERILMRQKLARAKRDLASALRTGESTVIQNGIRDVERQVIRQEAEAVASLET